MAHRGKSNNFIQVSAKFGIGLGQGEDYPSPMSRDDPEVSFIASFLWGSGSEAFMGSQLFAFPFSKEVISSWDVRLDRPQTIGCGSVGSELATPWHDRLQASKHTATPCPILDKAIY